MILLVILLILLFGFGGYRCGGPVWGGGLVGTILIILLILWLLGALPR